MPLPNILVPKFPNVAALPGVPQLVRTIAAYYADLQVTRGVQAAQSALWQASKIAPTWGIFNSKGVRVVVPDNVLNFDNRNEWRVSDFPVQLSAFASFNKVLLPPETAVRLTKGGSLSDRKVFIQQIETIAGDTNLYTIRTPEKSYPNVNVLRYEITRRGAEGAYYLAEVDIFFRAVVQITPLYSNTSANTANAQQPAAQPATNQGLLQPVAVTDAGLQQYVTTAVNQAPN